MIKRVLVLTLIAIMLFTTVSNALPALPNNTSFRMASVLERLAGITQGRINTALSRFSDMNHWSRDMVGRLTYLEIISGYPDGTFRPNNNINVDEFIKLTVTAMGHRPEAGDGNWAEPFIKIALEEGLITEGEFNRYNRNINRQEMAKIIVNALLTKEEAPNSNTLSLIRSFIRDYNEIDGRYRNEVLTAYAMGLIAGYPDGTFKGERNSTRAEASVVIMRFLDESLRVPARIDGNRAMIINDAQGNPQLFTNTDDDIFQVAKFMTTLLDKSKGYARMRYNSENGFIGLSFFEDEEKAFLQGRTTLGLTQLGISIDPTALSVYSVDIFHIQETDLLHYEVLEAYFKEMFKRDYDAFMREFTKAYNQVKNGNATDFRRVFVFNNRGVSFFVDSRGISVGITKKGDRMP